MPGPPSLSVNGSFHSLWVFSRQRRWDALVHYVWNHDIYTIRRKFTHARISFLLVAYRTTTLPDLITRFATLGKLLRTVLFTATSLPSEAIHVMAEARWKDWQWNDHSSSTNLSRSKVLLMYVLGTCSFTDHGCPLITLKWSFTETIPNSLIRNLIKANDSFKTYLWRIKQ